ncbi:hypothetical protein EYF80_057357 [Liparis tanakae]|uniref:Uncharacterized protein n=1 Tax=Liparis tanakae TaxID=230148 RepID=A0A4Z2EW72_9TELE|nr:hypothetical protein EYF80_057357 [Liparis tanakae]
MVLNTNGSAATPSTDEWARSVRPKASIMSKPEAPGGEQRGRRRDYFPDSSRPTHGAVLGLGRGQRRVGDAVPEHVGGRGQGHWVRGEEVRRGGEEERRGGEEERRRGEERRGGEEERRRGEEMSERHADVVLVHREDGHVVQRLGGEAVQQHGGLRAGQHHLVVRKNDPVLPDRLGGVGPVEPDLPGAQVGEAEVGGTRDVHQPRHQPAEQREVVDVVDVQVQRLRRHLPQLRLVGVLHTWATRGGKVSGSGSTSRPVLSPSPSLPTAMISTPALFSRPAAAMASS